MFFPRLFNLIRIGFVSISVGLVGLPLFAQNRDDFLKQIGRLINDLELEEALSVARQGLKFYPNDPAFSVTAGILSVRLGDLDGGLQLVEAALQQQPQNPDLLSSLAELKMLRGEYESALTVMSRAVSLDSRDAQKRSRFAWMLFVAGRMDEALFQAQKSVELAGVKTPFRKFYALLLGLTGNRDQQLHQLLKVFRESPDDPRILLRLSDQARSVGNLEQAMEYLELGMELDPENPLYASELSEVLQKLSLDQEAEMMRKKAENLESAFSSYQRALVSLEQGNFDDGIEILEPAIQKNPDFATGISLLAHLYRRSGDNNRALQLYLSMLERNPSYEPALHHSVWMKIEKQDLSGALRLLEGAGGGGVNGHLIRGYQKLLNEDWEGAVEELYAAQTQYPLNPRIVRQISLCLEELGRPSEALEMLERAYQAYPSDSGIHEDARRIRFNYGLQLEEKRQWKEALQVFERLHREERENAEYLFHIAFSQQNLTRYQEAIEFYRQGLLIDSSQDWVKINLAFCYTALNQYPEASSQWESLVEKSDNPEYVYHFGLSLIRQWKLETGWDQVRKAARKGFEPARKLLARAGLDE